MISTVSNKVKEFLRETLEAENIRIVRVDQTDGNWIAEAEVAEKNLYFASIQPQYRVFEKEHYLVKLNSNLEVSSYKRLKNGESGWEDPAYDF